MFLLKIADIIVKINNKYDYLFQLCKDFIVDDIAYDFEVTVSDEEIKNEILSVDKKFSLGYVEGICCYRKICSILPNYDAMLLHGAAVSVDNKGYIFCAKSGTGKTTHTKLWQKMLKDQMTYINGDKPIIRIIENKPVIFGTPWCGKENYGSNTSAQLKAICFIERNVDNSICKLNNTEVIKRIAHQILIPKDSDLVVKTFNILDQIISCIDIYLLKCNMELDAAYISYNFMHKHK